MTIIHNSQNSITFKNNTISNAIGLYVNDTDQNKYRMFIKSKLGKKYSDLPNIIIHICMRKRNYSGYDLFTGYFLLWEDEQYKHLQQFKIKSIGWKILDSKIKNTHKEFSNYINLTRNRFLKKFPNIGKDYDVFQTQDANKFNSYELLKEKKKQFLISDRYLLYDYLTVKDQSSDIARLKYLDNMVKRYQTQLRLNRDWNDRTLSSHPRRLNYVLSEIKDYKLKKEQLTPKRQDIILVAGLVKRQNIINSFIFSSIEQIKCITDTNVLQIIKEYV